MFPCLVRPLPWVFTAPMETHRRHVSLVALAALLEGACSGAAPGGSSVDEGDARLASVQSALVQPTGTVSPSTVRALADDWQLFEQAAPVFDAVLSVGAPAAQACLTGATPSGTDADDGTDGDGGGIPASGSYDLSCVTGGKVVGRLAFQLEPSPEAVSDAGVVQRLDVQLFGACTGGACVNAEAFAAIVPKAPLGCTAAVTLAVTATVTVAGTSRTFSFGAQGGADRSALAGITVYFDDEGRSLTVQSGDGAPPQAPLLVTGASDSFECTLAAAGGRCDGPTSFTY